MNKPKRSKFFGGRSVMLALSNLGLAPATPRHARSISQVPVDDSPNSHPDDRMDLSLDVSIAGFKTLKEIAEAVPVAGGPLKASCGIMISVLQLIKRSKENRERWGKLVKLMRRKNETIIALLELYSKAPEQYPSAERQAKEYQQVLDDIAADIKKETQRGSEASQGLETYWSKVQSIGREAALVNINAEKIGSYEEQLQGVAFDVIETTVINQALAMTQTNVLVNDMHADVKAMMTEKSSLKAPAAILKPRPRRVKNFVGRGDILDSMYKTHLSSENSTLNDEGPTITVLVGMGGSGKTQIAVKFASLFEERYPNVPVFFLDASSETSLNADLGTLVRSQTDKYDDALTWLANGITNWLLIMDNADDPSLKFSKFIPQAGHGHIVITTRNATHRLLAPQSFHVVDVLPMEDSISLLLASSCSEDNEVNRSLARDIAEELGRLPLALAHAAAYILVNSCLDTFLSTYSASQKKFLKSTPNLQQNYPHSVERTIEMSFERLSPRVREMMQLFSYMDARSIPRCIIEKAAERRFLHIPQGTQSPPHPDTISQANTLQDIFCPSGGWEAFEFDEMIGECMKYSLLQFSTADGEKFYSMHPLVQKYLHSASDTVRDYPAGRLVVRMLASATTVGGDWYDFIEFNRFLGPHVRLVRLEDVTEGGDHYGFGDILAELGSELSIAHMERYVESLRSSNGQDDEAVIIAISRLADSYYSSGREQKALPLHEEVLEYRRKLHGPGHLNTVIATGNLASCYSSLGRVQEALSLQEEVFKQYERLLGPDHLWTLTAMGNMALTYQSLGRVQEALPLREEVFKQYKILLGPDHLWTLTAMINVATTYQSLGRTQEALPLQEEVFKQYKILLGLDHLWTLTAMGNVATTYQSLGRTQEALPLNEEVFKQYKRLLGPDHLWTLMAMGNVANSYQSLGRSQEALPLEEEVLEKRMRLLGLDHRETLLAMRNLLGTLEALGMETNMKTLAETALPLHETLYGVDHEHTVRLRGLLM